MIIVDAAEGFARTAQVPAAERGVGATATNHPGLSKEIQETL